MFKASSLQRYIFATNKLREVVGASQLIANLADRYLSQTLGQLGLEHGADFDILQQAAGQATLLFYDHEPARRLYLVWPALVAQLAPGLEAHQWLGQVKGGDVFATLQAGWGALRELRNTRQPRLPELTPPVLRAPRTAQGAVGRAGSKRLRQDRASMRKYAVESESRGGLAGFEPADANPQWVGRKWSANLREIARGEHGYLGVIHADGNRLGGFLIELARSIAAHKQRNPLSDDEVVALYREFSTNLARVTRQAALDAVSLVALDEEEFVGASVAARPVVVGGDDVTLIVPAARAVDVCTEFLRRFETLSSQMLGELAGKYPLAVFEDEIARKFTACAGIVYQRHAQPLLTSYENAERLCAWAKRKSRRPDGTTVSTLMFARTIDSSQTDFRGRLQDDFVDPTSQVRLTAGPYSANPADGFVAMSLLREVCDAQARVSHGSLRGVVDALHLSAQESRWSLERVVDIHGGDGARLESLLHRVGSARGKAEARDPVHAGMSILPDTSILQFMEGV